MACIGNRNLSGRRQSSRLQRRAPPSIQINPVPEWKVAIPLLSPLVQSPDNLKAEINSCTSSDKGSAAVAEKPAAVMKKWQHPAAPFCYEPAPPFLPFVCTGSLDR
ncbi:hypothetical protein ABFS82_14G023600 [Erythranthe guttata]|uniref:Uncharacterized protein n=1 Tax=Erythranthe guttata TaxID=4155 RepID=A0A022QY80_ERYGU|nr:PREDICTED: uncharacterized protein At4g14450, chloroplastic [Erythranthe guttata]EYU32529.1 hypothetical protein MIMGU_mgv1a016842mg [Erythranthe guttata]|eukprot:XP_012842837.1 PREDICTED: uncharacterized protein At4g14450, chloroplastic [Erythranthe guttata]